MSCDQANLPTLTLDQRLCDWTNLYRVGYAAIFSFLTFNEKIVRLPLDRGVELNGSGVQKGTCFFFFLPQYEKESAFLVNIKLTFQVPPDQGKNGLN